MTDFKRSSFCGSGACVEVTTELRGGELTILVHDGKNPDDVPLAFDAEEWRAFIAGVKDGQFDV